MTRTEKYNNILKNVKEVEYLNTHDHRWEFIWRVNGERFSDWLTADDEEQAISEFIKEYPNAHECEFVEY